MTQERIYTKGSNTEGWKRGKKLTELADAEMGMALIRVGHDVQEERLYQVVDCGATFFSVQPMNESGEVLQLENIIGVHSYDLNRPALAEWFFAEKAKKNGKTKNTPISLADEDAKDTPAADAAKEGTDQPAEEPPTEPPAEEPPAKGKGKKGGKPRAGGKKAKK